MPSFQQTAICALVLFGWGNIYAVMLLCKGVAMFLVTSNIINCDIKGLIYDMIIDTHAIKAAMYTFASAAYLAGFKSGPRGYHFGKKLV